MVRNRRQIEELEDITLARYAMRSQDSKGRVYKESHHEVRTCYQRDRDRIVHSAEFRKLEYKTQVFVIFEGDYYRTRLTHTIEVAQMARTIGRSLMLNEDLIEAIALAHDLGHPPFGHAGEHALNQIMKKAGFSGFNHNRRSYEVVSSLEKRYPGFDGLNLSVEVLVGILKHETIYDIPSGTKQLKDIGPTLEAQVVDVADSIAYLTHDIDDGLTSGCISEEDLLPSALWHKAYKSARAVVKDGDKHMLKSQVVKQLIDMQIKDLLKETDKALQKTKFKTSKDVQKRKKRVIQFSAQMARERNQLQKVLLDKLYNHHRVVRMTSKAKRIVGDLFAEYIKEPAQLPTAVFTRGKKYSKKDLYYIICNHIASMTDRSALDEHKKFFNPYTKV